MDYFLTDNMEIKRFPFLSIRIKSVIMMIMIGGN